MEKIRKIYVAISPLPLVLFAGLWMYVGQFEGWGAWAAGPILLIPIAFSFLMGGLGIPLIIQARRAEKPDGKLIMAALLSGSLAIWILIKGLGMEIKKSFF